MLIHAWAATSCLLVPPCIALTTFHICAAYVMTHNYRSLTTETLRHLFARLLIAHLPAPGKVCMACMHQAAGALHNVQAGHMLCTGSNFCLTLKVQVGRYLASLKLRSATQRHNCTHELDVCANWFTRPLVWQYYPDCFWPVTPALNVLVFAGIQA